MGLPNRVKNPKESKKFEIIGKEKCEISVAEDGKLIIDCDSELDPQEAQMIAGISDDVTQRKKEETDTDEPSVSVPD